MQWPYKVLSICVSNYLCIPNNYCKVTYSFHCTGTVVDIRCVVLKKDRPDLADSETGDDTDAFFSFFPVPWPLFPPLCFGDPLNFLGESLMLDCSGNSWAAQDDRQDSKIRGQKKKRERETDHFSQHLNLPLGQQQLLFWRELHLSWWWSPPSCLNSPAPVSSTHAESSAASFPGTARSRNRLNLSLGESDGDGQSRLHHLRHKLDSGVVGSCGGKGKWMRLPSRVVSHSVGSSSLPGVRSFVIFMSSFSRRRPREESLCCQCK